MKRGIRIFLIFVAVFYLPLSGKLYAAAYIYISNSSEDTLSVISNLDNGVIDTVEVGRGPIGVAFTPGRDYLYVANSTDGTVSVMRTMDNSVIETIEVGVAPMGVVISPDGNSVYVVNSMDRTVSVIRTTDNSLTETVEVGASPMGIVATPEGDYVYVANSADGTVSIIRTTDNSVTETIEVGNTPWDVAVTHDGIYLFVTNKTDGNVSMIRIEDNTLVKTIEVGDDPLGITVGPDGDYIYVANNGNNTVSVIDTNFFTVIDTIEVGNGPWGVAVTNDKEFIYVVNNKENTVSKIRISDYSTTFFTVGIAPVGLGGFLGGRPPEAPSDLEVTEKSYKRIDLSWTDNSSDEFGFKIERKEGSNEEYTQIAVLDENVTTYSDTDLSYYRTYYYRITSYNDAADSGYTSEASATTDDYETECFLVTLAYGSPFNRYIRIIRGFRDRYLMSNALGKALVHIYYTLSPKAAHFIKAHDSIRNSLQFALIPLAWLCWLSLNINQISTISFILLLLVLYYAAFLKNLYRFNAMKIKAISTFK
ncbi:MAG: CFI-box-CTERM domain-containing protein [Thermodesulfobacteriota bacterium]|nr:CFI-box-CTERM domain-containing protein [Thermodesulfobacteriota bacterium]